MHMCTSRKAFFSAFISSFFFFFVPIFPVCSFGSKGKPKLSSPSKKSKRYESLDAKNSIIHEFTTNLHLHFHPVLPFVSSSCPLHVVYVVQVLSHFYHCLLLQMASLSLRNGMGRNERSITE